MTAAAVLPPVRPTRAPLTSVRRIGLPGARTDRLFFAQVREDPMLEIETLRPAFEGRIAIVGSGGCTALSLIASGARDVVAVDLNAVQNHLTELKAVAIAALPAETAMAFLGGSRRGALQRAFTYARLRNALSPAARDWWDDRLDAIRAGALGAGVSERLVRAVIAALRLIGYGPGRIERLLASRSLEEQRELFAREWNTRRWRMLIRLALGRRRLNDVYDPAFFDRVENESFGDHFLRRIEHGLTQLPVADNYFLRFMLTGAYGEREADARPPYLEGTGARVLADGVDRLTLVDGAMTDWLRTQPAGSIGGFSLSNICEWLAPEAMDDLFAEIARTATPGAIVCFRNFLGWTEVPERWHDVIVEDRPRGAALIQRDRSLLQRRFAPCVVRVEGR
jgi:S-adenosylmethionine-diacylglycerol 3-amino-3-carboxypropyl transferase